MELFVARPKPAQRVKFSQVHDFKGWRMSQVCRIYRRLCKRWGPRGMTLSAWAWVHAQETGDAWLRNRIDGLWLLLFGSHNHTQSSYQRERTNHGD